MYSVTVDIFALVLLIKPAIMLSIIPVQNAFNNARVYNAWVLCQINENEAVTGDRLADTCFTPVTHIQTAPTTDIAGLYSQIELFPKHVTS